MFSNRFGLILRFLYSDYFSTPPCLTRYQSMSPGYYLSNCFFQNIYYQFTSGGILFYENYHVNLVVEDSVFFNCSANGHGGVLYYSCSGYQGSVVFNKVCVSNCYITNNAGHYGSFSRVVISSNRFFNVEHSSIQNCFYLTFGFYHCISAIYGNQTTKSLNLSKNSVWHQAFTFSTVSFFEMSYCNVLDTYIGGSYVLYLASGTSLKTFDKCNIINNTSPSIGVIYIDGNDGGKINECIFSNNKDVLIGVPSSTVFVTNCWIDHYDSQKITVGALIQIQYAQYGSTSFYYLTYFGTAICISPTPGPTIEGGEGLEVLPCQTIPSTCLPISENLQNLLSRSQLFFLILKIIIFNIINE